MITWQAFSYHADGGAVAICIFWILKHCSWFKYSIGWVNLVLSLWKTIPSIRSVNTVHVFNGDPIAVSSEKKEPCNHNPCGNTTIHCALLESQYINRYLHVQNRTITWASVMTVFTGDPTEDPVGADRASFSSPKCNVLMLMDHRSKWPSVAKSKLYYLWILKRLQGIISNDLNNF